MGMSQPESMMVIIQAVLGGVNILGLLALAVVLGRYLQRVDDLERQVRSIQEGKTDVLIARLTEQVEHLSATVQDLQSQIRRISEFMVLSQRTEHERT